MIYQKNNFKVNRPLLNMHRFEIRQFVRFWKLPIYSDQSNQKTNFLRNRIRKQLMPTLRIFFNPQIDAVLLNFVEIKKNEEWYFQNVLNRLLKPSQCDPLFTFTLNKSRRQTRFVVECTNNLNYFSRNKIIYWLIVNNNLAKKINSYPNVFQKQILKTIFKTFNQVENASLHLRSSQRYERNLTQLLILKFIKKLFTLREKRTLLVVLKKLINKY